MNLEPMECTRQPGGLVHLLSAGEGSLPWADGMRQEIQDCLLQEEVDSEYVSHCLTLLRCTGGWRLLRDAQGFPFSSFIRFCYAACPYGLGVGPAELKSLLSD
jgi:hypothetical protein